MSSSLVLITDLDNTLVGDDQSLALLNQQLQQNRSQIKLVYSTGRSLFLYQELTKTHNLLIPDALITSVGTEIYFNLEQFTLDPDWCKLLSQGWQREKAVAIAQQFPELQSQPESEQNPFKISFYITSDLATRVLPQLRLALKNAGLATKLVYSAAQDLDILPIRGDKGSALQYLRQKWQLTPQNIVAAGDSGNDIALLTGEHCSIVVGNAKPELLKWYQEQANPRVYLAKAGYAAGILEGLRYFEQLNDRAKIY